MKKTIYVICLAFAVISCDDISKKIESVTEGNQETKNPETSSTSTEQPAPETPKTEEQIAQQAKELWMDKIAVGEWQNAYQGHKPEKERLYIKFDPPVMENGVITGEFQSKRIWYDTETIYFTRYTMLSDSKMEVEGKDKYILNGVEQENKYYVEGGKYIQFVKLFDDGNTLLITSADPDSDTNTGSVNTEIYKH